MLAPSSAQKSQFERRLNLSADQKPKVAAIMQRTIRQGDAIFRKHGVTAPEVVDVVPRRFVVFRLSVRVSVVASVPSS